MGRWGLTARRGRANPVAVPTLPSRRSAGNHRTWPSDNVRQVKCWFCQLMTLKARALGMTSTTYVNGLPAQEQIMTARDQVVLGRAIQPVSWLLPMFCDPQLRRQRPVQSRREPFWRQEPGETGARSPALEAAPTYRGIAPRGLVRWKRQRRTGNALPRRTQRVVEEGKALLKEALWGIR